MTSSGVDWSKVQGAGKKPKRLHLVGDEEGIFQSPILHWDDVGFSRQFKAVTSCSTHKIDQQETDG